MHESFPSLRNLNWDKQKPIVLMLVEFTDKLKTSNQEIFGDIFRSKRLLWARLEGVQRKIANGYKRHLSRIEEQIRKELKVVLFRKKACGTKSLDKMPYQIGIGTHPIFILPPSLGEKEIELKPYKMMMVTV